MIGTGLTGSQAGSLAIVLGARRPVPRQQCVQGEEKYTPVSAMVLKAEHGIPRVIGRYEIAILHALVAHYTRSRGIAHGGNEVTVPALLAVGNNSRPGFQIEWLDPGCSPRAQRHIRTMASLRAYLLVRLLRWRFKKPIVDPVDIGAIRANIGRPYSGRLPPGVRIVAAQEPVPGEWVISDQAAPDAPVMLYLHGGGFFACSPATHRIVTAAFAQSGALRLFVPDYRLAPEHRFPAAIDDAIACCDWIVAHTGRPVAAIAGDSAGGALTLATLLRLRDTGRALPAAGVAFSPVTDLAATGDSLVENDRRDAMFFGAGVARLAEVYLPPGVNRRDPLASPLYADLAGLPPLLLHVGADEVLRDDSVRFAARAKAAQVDVTLRIWPVVPHAWQLMAQLLPEGRQSLQGAIRFVSQAMAASQQAELASNARAAAACGQGEK